MMWGNLYGNGLYGGYGYPMMGYGYGPASVIFPILWIIVIVAVIIFLVRVITGRTRWHGWRAWGGTALEILKERYAKGEIDAKEFEERKKHLTE